MIFKSLFKNIIIETHLSIERETHPWSVSLCPFYIKFYRIYQIHYNQTLNFYTRSQGRHKSWIKCHNCFYSNMMLLYEWRHSFDLATLSWHTENFSGSPISNSVYKKMLISSTLTFTPQCLLFIYFTKRLMQRLNNKVIVGHLVTQDLTLKNSIYMSLILIHDLDSL